MTALNVKLILSILIKIIVDPAMMSFLIANCVASKTDVKNASLKLTLSKVGSVDNVLKF